MAFGKDRSTRRMDCMKVYVHQDRAICSLHESVEKQYCHSATELRKRKDLHTNRPYILNTAEAKQNHTETY